VYAKPPDGRACAVLFGALNDNTSSPLEGIIDTFLTDAGEVDGTHVTTALYGESCPA